MHALTNWRGEAVTDRALPRIHAAVPDCFLSYRNEKQRKKFS